MEDYNKQDVVLLENVYKELRPWIRNHPNYSLYTDDHDRRCVVCGSVNLESRGWAYTATQKYRRYQCTDCGKWNRGRSTDLGIEKRKTVLTGDSNR